MCIVRTQFLVRMEIITVIEESVAKCIAKCKVHPITCRDLHRGGVEWLYCFFNLSCRWGWVVNATPRPLYPRERNRYALYRRRCGPQGRSRRIWRKEFRARSRVRIPGRPARSESLYRLSYPGPRLHSSPPNYRPQVSLGLSLVCP